MRFGRPVRAPAGSPLLWVRWAGSTRISAGTDGSGCRSPCRTSSSTTRAATWPRSSPTTASSRCSAPPDLLDGARVPPARQPCAAAATPRQRAGPVPDHRRPARKQRPAAARVGMGLGDRDPRRDLRRSRRGGGDPERVQPGLGSSDRQEARPGAGTCAELPAARAVRARRAADDRPGRAGHGGRAVRCGCPGRRGRGRCGPERRAVRPGVPRAHRAKGGAARGGSRAVLAAVLWQVLQAVGTAFVEYQLRGSSQVYGLFGIVLGLLAWIYLQAVVIVVAAGLNVVLAERLWPRALLTPFVEDVDLTRPTGAATSRTPRPSGTARRRPSTSSSTHPPSARTTPARPEEAGREPAPRAARVAFVR